MKNSHMSTIADEIVFLKSTHQNYLIATNKNDTCYPFMFNLYSGSWSWSKRNLRTIDDDSIYRGDEGYDYITLHEAKAIIGDILPDEILLDSIDKYIEELKSMLKEKCKPQTKIRETHESLGEMIFIKSDETKSSRPLFKIGDKVKYKKGTAFSYNGDTIYPEEMPDYYIVEKGDVSFASLGVTKVTYQGKTVSIPTWNLELLTEEN